MCFLSAETHKTPARPQLDHSERVFKERLALCHALMYRLTGRQWSVCMHAAWRREYTHETAGQWLYSDIMQHFPPAWIQTRTAGGGGSWSEVKEPWGFKVRKKTAQTTAFQPSKLIHPAWKYPQRKTFLIGLSYLNHLPSTKKKA